MATKSRMRLAGSLKDVGLADILRIVSLSRKSGVLSLRGSQGEGEIVFLHGQVVYASSSTFPAPSEQRFELILSDLRSWEQGSFSFEIREPDALPPTPEKERDPSHVDLRAEILREMGEGSSGRPLSPPVTPGLHLLKGMLEELHNPSLGGGIILLVLRFASEFMNRAVVFHVREDEIVGLGQFGIEDPQADARVRGMRIPIDQPSLFSPVLTGTLPVKCRPGDGKWDDYLRAKLGGGMPEEVFLGPMRSEGKTVAVLYGDNLPEQRPIGDTEPLEIFLSQAGMAMEKALLERRLQNISSDR